MNKTRPQQSLWSFDFMRVSFIILTATFFLLMLYSILQANLSLFDIAPSRILSLKILDTSSAATLFVTMLGALLVRHQFTLSLLPRINYKSAKADRETPESLNEVCKTWRVDIRNTGLGSAIINRTEYFIEFNHAKASCRSYSFDTLLKELSEAGLVRDTDYWIRHLTAGFSLSPKDDCFVFEIKTDHRDKLNRLDMVLYFQGQLGDKYRREIFLVPHS